MLKNTLKNKLLIPIIAAVTLIGGIATGTATIVSAASSSTSSTVSTTQPTQMTGQMPQQGTPPTAVGKVTAISGSTITIDDQRAGATYTVDTSSATFTKEQGAAASLSDIAVGDMVAVEGTLSGTSITATAVHEGFGPGGHGGMGGPGGHGVQGTVSSISGSTITVTGQDGTTYTIDGSSATIQKMVTESLSDISVGDRIGVQGSVSGSSVTAKSIMDGTPTPPQTAQNQ